MSSEQSENTYDAVVVGAGAAGLSAVLSYIRSWKESGKAGSPSILAISKVPSLRSHTGSAEGGIAASLSNAGEDDSKWHFYDTVKGGDWLVDQDMAEILASQAAQTVRELEHFGVAFSRTEDGKIAQRRFGGHTRDYGKEPVARTAYSADRIGHQILYSLWQQCVKEGVEFAEDNYVTDLAIERDEQNRARARGIVVLTIRTGEVRGISASAVILATGGAGRIFHTTSNSWDLTGDGMALALRAGLQLEDIEFVQFHPTGLGHSGILLSEASRAEGGVLLNADKKRFMTDYEPNLKDLAPRHTVTKAIMSETKAGRGVTDPKDPGKRDCVWLDLRMLDEEVLNEKLPVVAESIKQYEKLDPKKDLIPVKPTAHYTMGGIPIGRDGNVYEWKNGLKNEIIGLFAAGECSCVSVHGANRLGSNSLLEVCVFGKRAGQGAFEHVCACLAEQEMQYGSNANIVAETAEKRRKEINSMLKAAKSRSIDSNNIDSSSINSDSKAKSENIYSVTKKLADTMERFFAVQCNGKSIENAEKIIKNEIVPAAQNAKIHNGQKTFNQELVAVFECRNMVILAEAMLCAAAARKESRGSFSRTDFPKRNDSEIPRHSFADINGNIENKPVTVTVFPVPGSE